MKQYSKAPSGVAERVAHLVRLFHPDLQNAGVKLDLISVTDDDPDVEHALKLRGYPAYACVKVVDIKGRTMGRGDAEIQIDEAKYLTMSDATKDAVLDHELEHVEVVRNPKNGRVRLDCQGRPKLKLRLHDIEYGHFISIAERHGAASIEVKQCTQLYLEHKQTLFAFAMDADVRQRLEAATETANPRAAARAQLERMGSKMQDGESVTITVAGQRGVTIDKDGVRPAEKA